jgi:histidinol phosphatase-like PHP family hydrolase
MDLYEFLEWSRLFKCCKGLAHTDIFSLGEKYGLDMIKTMRKYNIFWELNTSGNYSYYYDFLTNDKKRDIIKQSRIPVTIGSDTHDICEYRFKALKRANELIQKLGNPLP